MLPGDRLVCAFVEPQPVGTQFKTWLLHVTIVPWFRLEEATAVVAEGLVRALTIVGPFTAVGVGEALFGPQKNRPVRLLEPSAPFMQSEAKVRSYLHQKRAWLVDETTKRRYEFRPHVTAQGDLLLPAAVSFEIAQLYIVEQKGDYKEIVAEVRLDG